MFVRQGKIVLGAAGIVFEDDGGGIVVRHTRESHLAGLPIGFGVIADSERVRSKDGKQKIPRGPLIPAPALS